MANQQDNQRSGSEKDQSRQGSGQPDRGMGSQPQTSNRGVNKSPTSRGEEVGQNEGETETKEQGRNSSSDRDPRQDSKKAF